LRSGRSPRRSFAAAADKQGRWHVVVDRCFPQGFVFLQVPCDFLGRGIPFFVGKLNPGNPLRLPDHLGSNGPILGLCRQGSLKDGSPNAEAGQSGQSLAAAGAGGENGA
jgi:hypothetical protein